MAWDGIVDEGLDIVGEQVLLQLVAFLTLDHEEMVTMNKARPDFRETKPFVDPGQITRGQIPSGFVPLLQARQFHAQDGSLQFIQPAVVAHRFMMVLAGLAVIPEAP